MRAPAKLTAGSGVVDRCYLNTSLKGRPYLGVEIDGARYTVWDEKLFPLFAEGATVGFEFESRTERDGSEYRHIRKAAGDADAPPPGARPAQRPAPAPARSGPSAPGPGRADSERLSIERQTSAKAAAEIVRERCDVPPGELLALFQSLAEGIFAWIRGPAEQAARDAQQAARKTIYARMNELWTRAQTYLGQKIIAEVPKFPAETAATDSLTAFCEGLEAQLQKAYDAHLQELASQGGSPWAEQPAEQ